MTTPCGAVVVRPTSTSGGSLPTRPSSLDDNSATLGNEMPNAHGFRQNYLLELLHKKWLEQHLKKYKDPIRLLAENAWLKGYAQVQRSSVLPEAVV